MFDGLGRGATVANSGIGHHVFRVVCADRDLAGRHIVGNLYGRKRSWGRSPAHKNGPRCPIRRGSRLVLKCQQQQYLPDFGIDKTDSTGEASLFKGHDAPRAVSSRSDSKNKEANGS